MEIANNPVGRLHQIMAELRTCGSPEHKIGDMWAMVFRCEPEDTQAIYKGITSLFALNADAQDAVKRFVPGSPPFFLDPFTKIDQLLSNRALHSQWRNQSHWLDEATMTALTFVEHSLDSHYSTVPVGTNEKLTELLKKVDELIEACLSSDMSKDLIGVFVQQLQALRSAALQFRIFGPEGLEAALDQASGAVLRHQTAIKTELAGGNGLVHQFFDLLGRGNDLVSAYQTAAPAIAPVVVMLLDIVK